MSKKLAPSEFFKAEIYPSTFLVSVALLAILLGAISLFLALGVIGGLCLLPWIAWYGFQEVKKAALLSDRAVVHCQQISPEMWRLSTRVGHSFLMKKVHKAYRSPWLIILSFQTYPEAKSFVLPIARDSLTLKNYTFLLSQLL